MSGNTSIEATFALLKSKSAWGLVRTHGSMFFLEIGRPLPKGDRKNVRGEWHFLIEICHWKIENENAIMIGSDDDQELIDRRFVDLELGQVEEASSSAPSNDLCIVFSSGIRLTTFSASAAAKAEWTQWRLFRPDDNVWVVDGGGNLVSKNVHE